MSNNFDYSLLDIKSAATKYDYVSQVTVNPKLHIVDDKNYGVVESSAEKMKNFLNSSKLPLHNTIANSLTYVKNSVAVSDSGAIQPMTSLTYRIKEIVQQQYGDEYDKYLDMLNVKVGEGAYADQIQFPVLMGTGNNWRSSLSTNGRNKNTNTIDIIENMMYFKTMFSNTSISYNLVEVGRHAAGGFLDLVQQKISQQFQAYRTEHAELIALGDGDRLQGLLNYQDTQIHNGIYNDLNTIITKPISEMSAPEVVKFGLDAQHLFMEKTAYTGVSAGKMANILMVPLSDYRSMKSPLNPDFPLQGVTRESILKDMFADENSSLKIVGSRYCDKRYNNFGQNRYMLLDNSEGDFMLSINIPYTITTFATINNYEFTSEQFMQFTGVVITKPKAIYLSYS